MAVLVVSTNVDYRNQFFAEMVTEIDFVNGLEEVPGEMFPLFTYASATFKPAQVNGFPIASDVHVTGSAGHNEIKVIGGSADLSGWTFENWSPTVFDFASGTDIFSDSIVLEGGAFADNLVGTMFRDSLNGLGGADVMAGGAGDDTYFVNHALDVVSETGGGGNDNVFSNVSFTLTDGVEVLSLIGSSAAVILDGFGNALANTIHGSFLADNLKGFGGADALYGGGNQFNGVEVLDGGQGADFMSGGSGTTNFYVDNAGDVVEDIGNGAGIDTVFASRSYTLLANFEKLVLTGLGNFSGAGNAAANTITGNAFSNNLIGNGGADTVIGGLGDDILHGGRGTSNDMLDGGAGQDDHSGGGGADQFIFRAVTESGVTSTTRDAIFDFTADPASGSGFVDRINLAAIDAKAGTTGGQAFSFIGAAAFSTEGQVRAFQFGNDTMVQINTAGTGGVDSSILLVNVIATGLSQADFVL